MMVFRWFIGSDWLLFVFGLLGFTLQGGFVGLYAVAARMYPTNFRDHGTGMGDRHRPTGRCDRPCCGWCVDRDGLYDGLDLYDIRGTDILGRCGYFLPIL
ncbi:hypothetical protein NYZ99_12355 [Maribacter litopenaei]|uniref:Uncharacterized protein n=1 Tax=Maribacter litopenaei TaxID=2976127 RepID=A0ABY5Y4I4_9FLAO|nr:hypothetical protein [Maribacter litopenaei]UWX53908.1 hypothetical protein NYZ99_12355 [Maribacter litopenaei]